MRVFCVCGVTGSGKTTTVEKIIGELKKRGFSVGTVKDIHYKCFSLDTPGKNTWRHREAGAEIVVARGKAETDVLIPKRLEIAEVLNWFDQDYVVIEGGRDECFPKILTVKGPGEIDGKPDETVFAVSGVASGQNIKVDGVPVINALTDIAELVDIIEMKAQRI